MFCPFPQDALAHLGDLVADPALASWGPWPVKPERSVTHPLEELTRLLAVWRPHRHEEGQGLAEYALILALIALVAILSLIFLGDTIVELMDYIGSSVAASS